MKQNKYTIKQREQIIKLRDIEQKDFSEITKIMKLSQRVARNLYINTKQKLNSGKKTKAIK